jgi:hypothetical protein
VVVLEVAFVAVGGEPALARETARVVGEHVNARVLLQQGRREGAYVVETVVVGDKGRSADGCRDRRRALGVAPHDRHVPAVGCEPLGGLGADATARPRDHDGLAHV